jgi:hypothetical protein
VRIRGTSLIFAVIIVAVAMAGATWLQVFHQFPWIVFMALFFPALAIVVIAAGGPMVASGEIYVYVATYLLATLMWYGLIEGARRWWPCRRKRDHSSNA